MNRFQSFVPFSSVVLEHYIYAFAFCCIVAGLLSGVFRATYVFGTVVLALIMSRFMNISLIYDAAVNSSVLTVMVLISLTGILKNEVPLERLLSNLKTGKGSFLVLLTSSAAISSAVVNNTPVVSLLTPVVKDFSSKRGWNPKLFLLPLSFAAVAGGTITLIGTSTNLILNGMMLENDMAGFKLLEFFIPGIVVAIGVVFTTYLLSPKVFKTKSIQEAESREVRGYTTELQVVHDGSVDGLTVRAARLRGLKETFLVSLLRNGAVISPVSPDTVLKGDDTLFFTGSIHSVSNLLDVHPKGLISIERKMDIQQGANLIEAIIPNNSTLIERKLKESDFRNRYDAAIIGIQRNGKPVSGKLGEIILKPGDLLLLSIGKQFYSRHSIESSLTLISKHERISSERKKRKPYFFPSLLLILLLGFLLNWTILFTIVLMVLSSVFCGITHFEKLKKEFNLQLYALLVLSVAFGTAVVNGQHADYFLDMIRLPEDARAAILGVFGLTVILTNFMTNVSAVSVAFPIGAAIVHHYGIHSHDVFLPIAFAASASFLTPSSYQTHLIVLGAGSYSNREFFKLGLPTLITYCTLALLVLL